MCTMLPFFKATCIIFNFPQIDPDLNQVRTFSNTLLKQYYISRNGKQVTRTKKTIMIDFTKTIFAADDRQDNFSLKTVSSEDYQLAFSVVSVKKSLHSSSSPQKRRMLKNRLIKIFLQTGYRVCEARLGVGQL